MIRIAAIMVGAIVFCAQPAAEAQTILRVDCTATDPSPDGTTWPKAYPHVQDALAAAAGIAVPGSPVHIWVAECTYMPDGGYITPGGAHTSGSGFTSAEFQLIDNVEVYGGFPTGGGDGAFEARDPDPDSNGTVLSGDLSGDDGPLRVQDLAACFSGWDVPLQPGCETFDYDTDGDVDRLDLPSFLAANGYGENSSDVVWSVQTDASAILDGVRVSGAVDEGMYNHESSTTVTRCRFEGNASGGEGGGMHNFKSSPTLSHCTFSGNVADSRGGGLFNGSGGTPTLNDCTFDRNVSTSSGGGLANRGSVPNLSGCSFTGNVADWRGGAVYNETGITSLFANCSFIGNSAGTIGGGMYNGDLCTPTLVNCLFIANSSGQDGGGMYNDECAPLVANCTFSANTADGSGGGMHNVNSAPPVTNCVFWGNVSDADGTSGGPFTDERGQINPALLVSHTCIQDDDPDDASVPFGGTANGNIDDNPLFVRHPDPGPDGEWDGVDDDYGDLRLLPGSPCIDAGDNTAVPAGVIADLDGKSRFLDDPGTPDTGNGTPPIVDMGACERPALPPPVPALATPALVMTTLLLAAIGAVLVRRRATGGT